MQTLPTDKGQVLISYVIAYYNLPANMLRECVRSVLALTPPAAGREIILVDDGSDVRATDILKDETDEVTCIRQSNQGLSSARNTGMRLAHGKYIQFVDGDDTLIKSGCDRCTALLEAKQPDMLLFQTGSMKASSLRYKTDSMTGASHMLTHNIRARAWGYIFRKELLDGLVFTPGILHEDEEFTPLLLLRAKDVLSTDIKAYCYRSREDSITHKNNRRWKDRRLDDFEGVIIRLHEAADGMETDCKDALCRRVNQLCMDYLYNTLRLTGSIGAMRERAVRLRAHGLFPLADKHYTIKYRLFRLITKLVLS